MTDGDIESQESVAKPTSAWRNTLFLGFSSLGAIYGDIGTSPLYVFTSIFPEGEPSKADIIGSCSCIFWLFFLIVIVKYCCIVLHFGPNNDEGGQIAIYAKIAKCLSFGPRGVVVNDHGDLLTLTRSETHDSSTTYRVNNSGSKWYQRDLIQGGRYNKTLVKTYLSKITMALCFIGCGLVCSDGLLTPTTSVLSAVDGIAVAIPSFESKVLPVSCVILIVLFSIQGFGSSWISLMFAPIVFVWMVLMFVTGLINIIKHDASVFKALNPAEAIYFLQREGDIDKFGAIMLAITGTEAMFADIGHFSRFSIQLTLGFFVFPCLTIQYLGQAAYLIKHPEGISNVFYLAIPGGLGGHLYWVMFVFATLATVIASQALILGVFSILRQLIHLDCFPNFKVVHKNSKNFGQIYIPSVNWILMVFVVCTSVGFKTSSNVTAAYGLGVACDFVVTTTLITICLLYNYHANLFVALFFFVVFGALEICLVISGLKKVPKGAWFTLMATCLMTGFISFWRWCRSMKINQEYADRTKVRNMLVSCKANTTDDRQIAFELNDNTVAVEPQIQDSNTLSFTDPYYKLRYKDTLYDFHRYNGVGIMYTNIVHNMNSPSTVPKLFEKLLTSFPAAPKTLIFLSVRVLSAPYLNDEISLERIQAVNKSGLYRCVVKFGFMDSIKIDSKIINKIIELVKMDDVDEEVDEVSNLKHEDHEEDADAESKLLENTRVLHIIDNSIINSKVYPEQLYEDSNVIVRSAHRFKYGVRKLLVERCFAPIHNIFGGFEQSLEVDLGDLLLVGDRVKI